MAGRRAAKERVDLVVGWSLEGSTARLVTCRKGLLANEVLMYECGTCISRCVGVRVCLWGRSILMVCGEDGGGGGGGGGGVLVRIVL